MRLWSLHPAYLDRAGLLACWREALLAKAVLSGKTRGYRNHSQLDRFKLSGDPVGSINRYLIHLYAEARVRGYAFTASKIGDVSARAEPLVVTSGQLRFEVLHLRRKLRARKGVPRLKFERTIVPHPLFLITNGPVAAWERGSPVN